MSAALGMATARDLKGEAHKVVAVVGDGALTCGLSYEGMNNAGHSERDIILIVNDNGMSISPNVGAISTTLGRIVADPRTNRLREKIKGMTFALGGVFGEGVVDFAKNVEESVKNLFSPGMLFEELGFRYFGPIDGHDLPKLCDTLKLRARHERAPRHPRDDPEGEGLRLRRGQPGEVARPRGVRSGHRRGAEEGERPAHLDPGVRRRPHGARGRAPRAGGDHRRDAERHGTDIFQKKHPERFFDVGIAEGHAVTFAGGLATQGIRPVVAIYSTFLQRAYDNIIHDIAVQQLPVTFCMDRAGLVGEDGQTHMGLYDIAYMLAVPGMTVTAPKDGDELRRPAPHRAGAHRRPVLHPLPARQGARRAASGVRDPGRCPTAPGSGSGPARTWPSWPSARWCSRRCRRPSCSPPTASTARSSTPGSSSRSTTRCWSCCCRSTARW